jgi:transcriptional regulator with XRE-family HTH domain
MEDAGRVHSSNSLRGLAEQVGPQLVPADAGYALHFQHTLGRNPRPLPAKDRRLVQWRREPAAQHFERDLRRLRETKTGEWRNVVHAAKSCALYNVCQATKLHFTTTIYSATAFSLPRMLSPEHIHSPHEPNHRHFIAEWADHRGLRQADIITELGADKGTVSRWFSGTIPSDQWIVRLAHLLGTTRDGLFRDPHDDWFVQFFRDRSEEERARARVLLEAAFPMKKAG